MLEVFLAVVIFTGSGNGSYYTYHKMESMEVCLNAVHIAQINVSSGGDSEGAIAMFCTNGKGER